MRRSGGFTLLELMVVVCMMTVVLATMGGVGATIHREERHCAAYAQDLANLRRAVRLVERELRAADSAGDLDVRLDDGVLYQGGTVIARHIGVFEIEPAGDALARVRIGLAPRSDAPNRRDATLDLIVRMRGPAGAR